MSNDPPHPRRGAVNPSALDRLAVKLVYRTRIRRHSLLEQALRVLGVDIPPSVKVGAGLQLPHVGAGHTVHWNTTLGERVTINCGVVIGRADLTGESGNPAEFHIGDDVILGANACVMGKGGNPLTIGDGTVIGANAVLTQSTGAGEVWVGNPARRIPSQSRRDASPRSLHHSVAAAND